MEAACCVFLENYMDPNYLKSVAFEDIEYKNPQYFLKLENIVLPQNKIQTKVCMEFSILNKYTGTQMDEFRKRILDFYVECVHQIIIRFPFKTKFVHLSFLCPENG